MRASSCVWTEKITELAGFSTVLDNGYLDQLVAFGMPESSQSRDSGGESIEGVPLVM